MSTPANTHGTAVPPTGATPEKPVPETVRLLLQLWAVMVVLELVHQLLNVAMSFMDTTQLQSIAREQLAGEQQVSDAMISAAATASILLMGLFNLIIVGVLAWMVVIVRRRGRRLPTALLLLMIFGFFFIIRALFLFLASPVAGDVPIAMYAIDGSVQILVAVTAAVAYALTRKEEAVNWLIPEEYRK